MIDFLLWLFERLSSFDFENDLFSEFTEFMINLLNDHLEHLCCSESLIAFSKSSINVLKKNQSFKSLKSFLFDINTLNFQYLSWCSTVNPVWWWLIKDHFNRNIINSTFFNQSRLNVSINSFSHFKQKKRKSTFFTSRSFTFF